MLNLNNTKNAFNYKSTAQLQKARLMFKMVSQPWLVKIGKYVTRFALFIHFPIKPFVKPTIFSQFCGGETIDDCDETINKIGQYNVGSILDYSVEGTEEPEAHIKTAKNIMETINKAANTPNIPYAVFKVSGVSRDTFLEEINDKLDNLSGDHRKEYNEVLERIDNLCKRAFEVDVPIYVDAEDFSMQNVIDSVAWEMMLRYNKEKAIVFNTIQAYRVDRFEFLKKEHLRAKQAGIKYGVKLVRGAYMEKERDRAEENGYPSPIHENKDATDNCFNKCLRYIVNNLKDFSLCMGTHNEESTLILTEMMKEKGISKDDDRIVFAQLLGMSDHITFNLSSNGYPAAKYVPFGPVRDVMPYLIRRAEENSSVSGQTYRELELIKHELRRRKNKTDSGDAEPKKSKDKKDKDKIIKEAKVEDLDEQEVV
jgi:proline dehydrogenase